MAVPAAEAFFTAASNQAAEAERRAGAMLEACYEIAGLTVKLRVAGALLARILTRALAHLVADDRLEPDLTIDCWDCAALGLDYLLAPVGVEAFTPRGEVRGLSGTRYQASFSPYGRMLSFADLSARRAFHCVGDAREIPRFEAAEPLRAILAWLMRAPGRQLIHAGAVGRREGGVLLLGRSGAGKSNTTLRCLAAGLDYIADDFCAISASGPPRAFSLYGTAKTRRDDWDSNPGLASLAPDLDPDGVEKVTYYLHDAVPEQLARSFPIRAALALRQGGDARGLRPIPAGAALARAAPDTAMLLPGAGAEVLQTMASLFRSVPCYEFTLGPDPTAIAPAIDALIASLTPGPAS